MSPANFSPLYTAHVASNQFFKPTRLHTVMGIILWQMFATNTAMAKQTDMTASNEPIPTTILDTIVIQSIQSPTNATKTTVTQKQIDQQLIQSQADLVRYNPDVSVAEVGRYGSKGFAIRGVDGNRIAMSLDGVGLPEQQINQIFSPYGYMFEGRYSPDVELLSSVKLQAGADAFTAGNGAVGGAVDYQSKEPRHLLQGDKNLGGYLKTGYSNKDEEWMTAFGLAGRNDNFEALINYVHRDGHELKNHQMQAHNEDKLDPSYKFPENEIGRQGILPDPTHYKSDATLAKLYWKPTDEHKFGIHGSVQQRKDDTQAITKRTYSARRIGHDEANLSSYGLSYQYLPKDSKFIDQIKTDITHQKVEGIANTDIYTPKWQTELYVFDSNEYRPQTDTTDQVSVSVESLPVVTEKFGSHTFNFAAQYSKLDHQLLLKSQTKYGDYTQFIGPSVKKDVYSLALADTIQVNDKLNIKAGIRYDDHEYKPYMSDTDKASLAKTSDRYYAKKLYLNGEFDKTNHMNQVGGLLALDYQIHPIWQLGYKVSTGFLAPSTSQMYSAFEMLGNRLTTNVNLKPEKSLNHELSLQGNFEKGSLNATAFYTNYKDFINTIYSEEAEKTCYDYWGEEVCDNRIVNFIKADNIDKAKTYGIRLGGIWDVSNWVQNNGTLKVTGDISLAKDSTSQSINLLATNPPMGIFGIDYTTADSTLDLHAKIRYLGAKKPNDAKVKDYIYQDKDFSKEVITPYKHIDASNTAIVYDLYGTKSLGKGLSLSAGVYNLFDKKYTPWSSLRSLAEFNVNSMVDDKGQGLARYTAPGRNYALSLSYQF